MCEEKTSMPLIGEKAPEFQAETTQGTIGRVLRINISTRIWGRRWSWRPPPPNRTARTGQVSRSSISDRTVVRDALS